METTASQLVTDKIIEEDLKCVWHPYTQAKIASLPIHIVRGEGPYLYTYDGRRIIDAISSWWVNLHGHAHPYIVEKIVEQAKTLEHVIFAEFTHQPAVMLASRLVEILPGKMSKIFYTDNGSTAIEAALKMALQYWYNQNPATKKTKIISFKNGYHGDTFGAMAAAAKNDFNKPFWPFLFDVASIDPPVKGKEELSFFQLEKLLSQNDCACFIFEPIIQGVGGMLKHSSEGLDALIKLCQDYGVLTIADEVMTGFGRTGPLFACDVLTYKPDIMCLSKGLTGGFLPLGATACRQEIFDMFLADDKSKALLHGHSYTANPLACTAALASLDLLLNVDCANQRNRIEESHLKMKSRLTSHPNIARCDVTGTILALEYHSKEDSSYFNTLRDRLLQFFLSRQILLRPLGNVVYVLPPYCTQNKDLEEIYMAITQTLEGDF
jgi:adenosylmethionine---8-amino-7-oxononanoate aminotransferase